VGRLQLVEVVNPLKTKRFTSTTSLAARHTDARARHTTTRLQRSNGVDVRQAEVGGRTHGKRLVFIWPGIGTVL